MGRIHYVKEKEFNGVFKFELLESPPTIILVLYTDQDGNKITPDKLIKLWDKCTPYIIKKKRKKKEKVTQ